MESYIKLFTDLEESWRVFKNNQEDEKFVVKEFKNLLRLTLVANLDVSFINRLALLKALIASIFSFVRYSTPIALATIKRTELRA